MSSVPALFKGTVYLASDHAGFALRNAIGDKLIAAHVHVVDIGPTKLSPDDDYPDFIEPAAEKVAADSASRGIVFGKTGEGEAMDANRYQGVRAAVYNSDNLELITLAREHNDANILSIGAGFLTEEQTWEAVKLFLTTEFSGDERHVRRIAKLDD